ncbi:MAG TPA: ATP-binding protein [Lachnospiraceae bacterium]|nr:ATP-binding protein [Lachnospiraceae bacterium]
MGVVKNFVKKVGQKAGDKVAKLSELSPAQLEQIEELRNQYLLENPDPNDPTQTKQTERLLAASSVEIFNAYLPQIKDLYLPIDSNAEHGGKEFDDAHNIRYINITKWVADKKENNLEKLVNVYAVLSDEDCNIALVFDRKQNTTNVYLAVVNNKNSSNSTDVDIYKQQIIEAIRGNFPGAEWDEGEGIGVLPCFQNNKNYSVSMASNIPTEKSEKFVSQTIEKLIDGIIPETRKEEYTIVLLATPIRDVEERKLDLGEFYSGLAPYASWSTSFQRTENKSVSSSATVGVNVGVSAGLQNTDSAGFSNTDSEANSSSLTGQKSVSDQLGVNASVNAGAQIGFAGSGATLGATVGGSYAHTTAKSIAGTLGRAVTKAASTSAQVAKGASLGGNLGANFARSSTTTVLVGKNEGITQSYTNFNVQHALELLKVQMKRLELSSSLGMWDFATYVLSEDFNVSNNVAHSYLALTLGEESYMSKSAINTWRSGIENEEGQAKVICDYVKMLRHPSFGLNPEVVGKDYNDNSHLEVDDESEFIVYPPIVTATTSLSGKELAYSLNFPQKSIAGLPVLECVEFGRNIVTFGGKNSDDETVELGKIFHMNHQENTDVSLSKKSLASHTFITGSTGSGKSNTVYYMLEELMKKGAKFLVVEPAKGEYKNVFGTRDDVSVYGTNPLISPLLRINPFSFPNKIHVLEHMDRLVELFNVCWPMYAAMPAVLKGAVEKSYADCGWDLVKSVNKFGEEIYPSFSDVARNVKSIIDTSEYDAENKGAYKGSLLTRLQSLCNGINGMLFCSDEIKEEDLFDENVIVDLSRVGSSETKSLIMGMMVLKLQEYRMSSASGMNSELKHITVLEEAHNLLKRTSSVQSSEGSNLLGKSVEMLSNAIAEMRTYGEGFIIADQAPGLMDMSVIRNTNTKIILRLPDLSDRELVGRAANLNEDQISELAKLPCGVSAVYQNEWIQPVLCKVNLFDTFGTDYSFSPDEHNIDKFNKTEIEESLLDCIMNNEILCKGNKTELRALKTKIIKSKLETKVKVDFLDYIDSAEKDSIGRLRALVYDMLSAENAIIEAKQCSDIIEWTRTVVDRLEPSIKQYSNKQIDLALALILYEQTERDSQYSNIFCRFTEVYQERGGVL